MLSSIEIKNLSKNLATIRHYYGLSQVEFSELIGSNKQKVYNYEKGITTPKYDVINKLSELTGVPSAKLLKKVIKPNEIVNKSVKSSTKSKGVTESPTLLRLFAEIKAQNIVILKQQAAIAANPNSKKYLIVIANTNKEVEQLTEEILNQFTHF